MTAYHSLKYQHAFMQYLEKKLGIHSDACFDGQAITKEVAQAWSDYTQRFKAVNLRSDTAAHRHISTYVQCFWGGDMGKRHVLHDMPHVPHDVFTSWISLRFLQTPMPAYHQPRVDSRVPYSQRFCPAGCSCPCDVQHVLLECPATERYRMAHLHNAPARVVDLFDADLYDQLDVAHMIHIISKDFHKLAVSGPDVSDLSDL